jgi:predicted regulator of Ras-like GTPase activity (Roadblock/LC7/MglB family)
MDIQEIFARIEEEVPGYEAAIAGVIGGEPLATGSAGELDLAPQALALGEMVAAYHKAHHGLGGILTLGGNDEILVTTSKHYLLTRLHHDKGRYLTVAIAASGNIGYLRIKMKRYLEAILVA